MPNEFSRTLRVAEQIKRELAPLIQTQAKEARIGLVTITAVEVTPDLRQAKLYVTGLGAKPQEIVAALSRSSGVMRHYLSRNLRLRTVPRLTIVFDESVERGARICALLDSLRDPTSSPSGSQSSEEVGSL